MDATTTSSTSTNTHIRSRVTVVCAECKRLKLKCDRRTPCDKCIKRETTARCIYTAAASEKIDVQSLHNRLLSVEYVISYLLPQLGLSPEQIHALANNGTPPEKLDLSHLVSGVPTGDKASPNSVSHPPSSPAQSPPLSKPAPPSLIAFSSAPYDPSPSLPFSDSSTLKPGSRADALAADIKNLSLGASTAVFGGSSILVPLEELSIWTEVLGLDFLARSFGDDAESRSLMQASTASEFDRFPLTSNVKKTRNGSKMSAENISALRLAVDLFLNPNPPAANPDMFRPLVPGLAPPPPPPSPSASSEPHSWTAHMILPPAPPPPPPGLANGSGYANPLFSGPSSSPSINSNIPAPQFSFPMPPSSAPFVAGTITAVHITYLPTPTGKNLRAILWADFENVMVVHPCCISLKNFKQRVDSMYRWAEGAHSGFTTSTPALRRKHKLGLTTMRVRTGGKVISSSGNGKKGGSLIGRADEHMEYVEEGSAHGSDEHMTSISAPAAFSADKNFEDDGNSGRSKRRRGSGIRESGTTHSSASTQVSSAVSSGFSGSSNGSRLRPGPSTTTSHSSSSHSQDEQLPPTLAFFACVAGAYALGAQGYTSRLTHAENGAYRPCPGSSVLSTTPTMDDPERRRQGPSDMAGGRWNKRNDQGTGTRSSDEDDGSGESRSSSVARMPPPPESSSHGLAALGLPMSAFAPVTSAISSTPPSFQPPATDPHLSHSIPSPPPSSSVHPAFLLKPYDASSLHRLCQAALIAHDTLNLPPSLDYIVAHIMCWLFKLHATTTPTFQPTSPSQTHYASSPDSGEDNNNVPPTTIDLDIWKGLGKIVNVARGMGLGIDPDDTSGRSPSSSSGGRSDHDRDEDMDGEGNAYGQDGEMSLWEKEMRRRVWWDICYYDLFVSDCMGFPPLIDDAQNSTRMPSDVDESVFGPFSTSLPLPRFQPQTTDENDARSALSEATNFSYFIQKCKLLMLMKSMKKRSFRDNNSGEPSLESARQFEKEIQDFIKQLPQELSLDSHAGHAGDDHSNMPSPYPGMNVSSPHSNPGASPHGIPTSSSFTSPHGAASVFLLSASTPKTDLQAPNAFPASDILAAQACELRSLAYALILKLWTRFLSFKTDQDPTQWVSLSSATAAFNIVVSSSHLLNRFRFIRPAAYSFYGFGKMVFHAGLVLANVVIKSPELLFAESALKGLEGAIDIMKDPVVAGLGMRQVPSSNQDFLGLQPSITQATKILERMKSAADSAFLGFGFSLGAKRKHDVSEDPAKDGIVASSLFPLPYVGGSVTAGPLHGHARDEKARGEDTTMSEAAGPGSSFHPSPSPGSSISTRPKSPVQPGRYSHSRSSSSHQLMPSPAAPHESSASLMNSNGVIFWAQDNSTSATPNVAYDPSNHTSRSRGGSVVSARSDARSESVSDRSSAVSRRNYPYVGRRLRDPDPGVKNETASSDVGPYGMGSTRSARGTSRVSDISSKSLNDLDANGRRGNRRPSKKPAPAMSQAVPEGPANMTIPLPPPPVNFSMTTPIQPINSSNIENRYHIPHLPQQNISHQAGMNPMSAPGDYALASSYSQSMQPQIRVPPTQSGHPLPHGGAPHAVVDGYANPSASYAHTIITGAPANQYSSQSVVNSSLGGIGGSYATYSTSGQGEGVSYPSAFMQAQQQHQSQQQHEQPQFQQSSDSSNMLFDIAHHPQGHQQQQDYGVVSQQAWNNAAPHTSGQWGDQSNY